MEKCVMKMVNTGLRVYKNCDATADTSPFSYMSDTVTSSATCSTATLELYVYSTDFAYQYQYVSEPIKIFFQPWKVESPKEKYHRLRKKIFILWSRMFIRRIARITKHKSRQYYYRGIK
jgi:hypothetical protein